jgi:hypothetical protein
MAIPEKREDLVALGWVYSGDGKCRGCGEPVEWWITNNDKRIPMSVVDVKDTTKTFPQPILRTIRVAHFTNCPNAADFRKGKK